VGMNVKGDLIQIEKKKITKTKKQKTKKSDRKKPKRLVLKSN
jgi:hypothetical protein